MARRKSKKPDVVPVFDVNGDWSEEQISMWMVRTAQIRERLETEKLSFETLVQLRNELWTINILYLYGGTPGRAEYMMQAIGDDWAKLKVLRDKNAELAKEIIHRKHANGHA